LITDPDKGKLKLVKGWNLLPVVEVGRHETAESNTVLTAA
jgi:hypothetical protein